MFSLEVVDTDRFLDMPASTQALYFHLGMRADDDGFVAAPRKIIAMCNCSADDLRILISKNYVIPFKSGVCVVTDWLKNNFLRSDRRKPTQYQDELNLLSVADKTYYVSEEGSDTLVYQSADFGIPNHIQEREHIGKLTQENIKTNITRRGLDSEVIYKIQQDERLSQTDISDNTQTLDNTNTLDNSHSPDSSPNLSSIYPPIIPPLSSSPCPSSTPSPKETVLSVLSSFNFGEELEETVRDWLEYKREKRQNYKAVGLKTLLGQIKRYAERYGDDAMIELIRDSMASNYQGITFDRLKRTPVRSGDRLSWIDEVKLD
jgi:hypothetical protein